MVGASPSMVAQKPRPQHKLRSLLRPNSKGKIGRGFAVGCSQVTNNISDAAALYRFENGRTGRGLG